MWTVTFWEDRNTMITIRIFGWNQMNKQKRNNVHLNEQTEEKQCPSGCVEVISSTECVQSCRSKVRHTCIQTTYNVVRKGHSSRFQNTVLRINLNIDGDPIGSRSVTHLSHTQTSYLISSSLSLGIPLHPLHLVCVRISSDPPVLVFGLWYHTRYEEETRGPEWMWGVWSWGGWGCVYCGQVVGTPKFFQPTDQTGCHRTCVPVKKVCYYEAIKRELHRRRIYECRSYERLKQEVLLLIDKTKAK